MGQRRRGTKENPDQLGLPLSVHRQRAAGGPGAPSWPDGRPDAWREPAEEDPPDPPTRPVA